MTDPQPNAPRVVLPGEGGGHDPNPTLLRLALQAAGLGVAHSDDLRGSTLAIDSTVCALAGLPPGTTELTPQRWLDLVHPDDRPAVQALAGQLLPDGGAFTTSFRLVWPDGRTRHVVASGAATLQGDGRIPFNGLMQDVTAAAEPAAPLIALDAHMSERAAGLEAANAALSADRDRFQALFHSNPLPCALYDPAEDRLIDANAAYLAFYDLPAERVVGRAGGDLDVLLSEADRRRLVEAIPPEGGAQNIEITLPDAGDQPRVVLVSVQRLALAGRTYVLTGMVDVSALKLAEVETRRLASRLTLAEQSDRLRISAILHDDLQQRLYALQVRLAATVARALRGDHAAAAEEAERTRALLEEALTLTRNLSIDISPPVLKDESLYHALLWLGKRLQQQYNLSVDVQLLTPWQPLTVGLRATLFQITRSLLHNVVRFADIDRATVLLAQDDTHVRLIIADLGIGYNPATTPEGGGLSQARRRVELLGGCMDIDTQPGAGTTITLTIPVHVEDVSDHD